MKRLRNRAKGQIAVLFSVAIVALLGAVALGTDVAVLYMNWEGMQKAADAAVLAGANFLPSSPDIAKSTALQYAQINGVQQSEIVKVDLNGNNTQIEMVVRRSVPYSFGKVLGLTTGIVKVRAVAGILASSSARGLVPIGIQYGTSLTPYQTISLHMAPQNQVIGPGNWEPLAMGYSANQDAGGSNYKQNIINGYPNTISINDFIYTEPGQLNGPTQQGVNTRINAGLTSDPSGTDTTHVLNDPRMIEVPIINFNNVNGSGAVEVMGFAELWIESVDGSGTITAEFINQVVADNTPDPNVTSYGAFTVVLMQ